MLDIQTRKILFLQEFLRLNSEKSIAKLEQLLNKEMKSADKTNLSPMTVEELSQRIDRSEADFSSGRYKESDDLTKKYDQ